MNHLTLRSLDYWFPTVIYKELCDDTTDSNKCLKIKALELQKNFENTVNTDWRCNTFNTLKTYDYVQDHDSVVLSLIEKARYRVHEFAKQYGVNKPIESLTVKDFWFNVAGNNAYQEYHQHALSHFSVVYYVNAPKKSGNIVFQSSENIIDMFPLPLDSQNFTELSFKTCSYEPQESMMLIFRSNLMHMVEMNLSGEDRISIAINFEFKG
jgi:uncharacterized protein (TIGR02466 family)